MVVTCTQCQAMMSVGRNELLSGVANCEQCGALLDVAATSDVPSAMLDEPAAPRTPVPPPPEITVEKANEQAIGGAGYRGERREGITLWRTRRKRTRLPLAIRVVMLVALVAVWLYDAFALESIVLAVVLVPVTAGVMVAAFDHLARYNNRLRIHADAERILVSDGPLPSPSIEREVPRDDLRQLYAVAAGKLDIGLGPYQVRALRTGDVTVLLVEGLDTPEEALFIEQQLEAALGITDREVAGELGRKRAQGVPKGWYLTHADRGRGMGPVIRRAAIATAICALPATAIALYHDTETLAEVALRDESQTMTVEVTPSRPDVYLAVRADINIGDMRPNLPQLDAMLTVRKPGEEQGRDIACEITRADDVHYTFRRVDNMPEQHVSWYGRLEHCPLELEPGTWEIDVRARWRDRGLKTDRVEYLDLAVEARR